MDAINLGRKAGLFQLDSVHDYTEASTSEVHFIDGRALKMSLSD